MKSQMNTDEHNAAVGRNRKGGANVPTNQTVQGILKPQMNADERRCIEVNAETPRTSIHEFFGSFAQSRPRAWQGPETLDFVARLGTSAFICVHLRFQYRFGTTNGATDI